MNKRITLAQAKHYLAQCEDWTNTAALLNNREHADALDMEWSAMVEVCRLEHEAKNCFALYNSVSMRKA